MGCQNRFFFVLLSCCLWIQSIFAFSCPWLIRRCPPQIVRAFSCCQEEVAQYVCDCVLINLFKNENVDVPYLESIIKSVEIDHPDSGVAYRRRRLFIKAAIKTVKRCHAKYRAGYYPRIFRYRGCICTLLEGVCQSMNLYRGPQQGNLIPYGLQTTKKA